MKETQLLKGVLEGCVLAVIAQKEIYGYELVQTLKEKGFTSIVGGTVYPLLQKLEKQNLIIGVRKPSLDGPNRKYFTLTQDGEKSLSEFIMYWQGLVGKVDRLLSDYQTEGDCDEK
ncbi:PadR family transcriptional regulator [Amphibacillus sp. Q70]|uniref:PadR family transcriptional regulator n=1 Tax=Amphibacillus sp. Q70 TaxID=3453416 RepID=UPI003F871106